MRKKLNAQDSRANYFLPMKIGFQYQRFSRNADYILANSNRCSFIPLIAMSKCRNRNDATPSAMT